VGKPGSGKSHILYEMLANSDLYYKKFDYVFILSPSEIGDIKPNDENFSAEFSLAWL